MAKHKDVDVEEVKECSNHHCACACRESYFMELEAALSALVEEIEDADNWLRYTDSFVYAKDILGNDIEGKMPS